MITVTGELGGILKVWALGHLITHRGESGAHGMQWGLSNAVPMLSYVISHTVRMSIVQRTDMAI